MNMMLWLCGLVCLAVTVAARPHFGSGGGNELFGSGDPPFMSGSGRPPRPPTTEIPEEEKRAIFGSGFDFNGANEHGSFGFGGDHPHGSRPPFEGDFGGHPDGSRPPFSGDFGGQRPDGSGPPFSGDFGGSGNRPRPWGSHGPWNPDFFGSGDARPPSGAEFKRGFLGSGRPEFGFPGSGRPDFGNIPSDFEGGFHPSGPPPGGFGSGLPPSGPPRRIGNWNTGDFEFGEGSFPPPPSGLRPKPSGNQIAVDPVE